MGKQDHVFGTASCRRGIVLPVVLLSLLALTTLAMAALVTSSDEFRSSRAMRESSAAFYVAEAGLHKTLAEWSTWQTTIDSLAGGDSLDIGWQTLANGTSYRSVVHRWDNGDQPVFQMSVEGRGKGALSGQKSLSLLLTSVPGSGSGYMLGDCCDATMVIRGALDLSSRAPAADPWLGEIDISGMDTHPPGWEGAGVCSADTYDKPAVIMEDSSLVVDNYPYISSSCDRYPGNVCAVTYEGVPQGIVEDPTVTASAWDQFGDLSWDSLATLADHQIGAWGTQLKLKGDDIFPRYNADGTCDTSHPYNWGSDDPNDACFNHFPIILLKGEIEFKKSWAPERAYGQGTLILDWNAALLKGTELELGRDGEFRGIVLGKGCVEIQKGHQFYGSIYVDHTYSGPSCDAAGAFIDCRGHNSSSGGMCDNTTIQWSQCAVDRAMSNSVLADYADVTNPAGGGATRILSRSFSEMLQ